MDSEITYNLAVVEAQIKKAGESEIEPYLVWPILHPYKFENNQS